MGRAFFPVRYDSPALKPPWSLPRTLRHDRRQIRFSQDGRDFGPVVGVCSVVVHRSMAW